jgi:uncharacterized protein with PQ loop repeat
MIFLLSQITAYLALALWTFPVIPQIWKNYQSRSTVGLSIYMYLLNISSATLFAAFAIQSALPLPSIIQPHVFIASCIIVISQIWRHEKQYSMLKTLSLTVLLVTTTAAIELAGYFLLTSATSPYVGMFYGIFCSIVAFVGYVPQMLKTYRSKDARAISLVFLGLTISGGVLFLLSLMFKALADSDTVAFNWIAALTYGNVTGGAMILAVQYMVYRKRQGDVENEWKECADMATELNDTSSQVTCVEVNEEEEKSVALYGMEKGA